MPEHTDSSGPVRHYAYVTELAQVVKRVAKLEEIVGIGKPAKVQEKRSKRKTTHVEIRRICLKSFQVKLGKKHLTDRELAECAFEVQEKVNKAIDLNQTKIIREEKNNIRWIMTQLEEDLKDQPEWDQS